VALSIRRSAVVLSLVLVALAFRTVAAAGEVIPLRLAVKSGRIDVRGVDPGSYQKVTLELRNRTSRTLEINLCGSFLCPEERNSCQRLGLGPLVGSPERTRQRAGAVLVNLRPLEKRRITVRTVCLDLGKPAPSNEVFEAATTPLPPVREKVLTWWVDNPETPQGRVNEAIWQNRAAVRTGASRSEAYRVPTRRRVAAFGGAVYTIVDGELTVIGADGTKRLLGTCIRQVFPTSRGLYAIGFGPGGGAELWVHEQTGERPWRRVCGLGSRTSVRDVVTVPVVKRSWFRGLTSREGLVAGMLLVTTKGVCVIEKSSLGNRTREVEGSGGCDSSVRLRGKQALQISVERAGRDGTERGGRVEKATSPSREFGELDLKTGRVDFTRRFWNIAQIAMGEAGLFALTPAGSLKRYDGKRFHILGTGLRCDQILAVGRNVLWMDMKGAGLASVDARTGRVRHIRNVPISRATSIGLDRITDDLVLVLGERFLRIRGEDGVVEVLR
jgi:hypothetical protein